LIIAAMENNNPEVLNALIQAGADVTEDIVEAAQNNDSEGHRNCRRTEEKS